MASDTRQQLAVNNQRPPTHAASERSTPSDGCAGFRAVRVECRCSSRVLVAEVRFRDITSARAALAEGGAADRVQARCSRLPLPPWHCATVPRQRLPACRRPRHEAAPALGVNTRSRRSSIAAVHCRRPCLSRGHGKQPTPTHTTSAPRRQMDVRLRAPNSPIATQLIVSLHYVITRPHRMHRMKSAAYCYRRSASVCQCVC